MSQDLLRKYMSLSETDFEKMLTSEEYKGGSGWDPATIREELGFFEPIPYSTAFQVCEANKTKFFSALFKKPAPHEVQVTSARLEARPYWLVAGFYFCSFLRESEYTVQVNPDVLAVYLEGKVRSVQQPQPKQQPSPQPEKEKSRLGFLKRIPIPTTAKPSTQQQYNFFQLKGAIELAIIYNEGYSYINGVTGIEDAIFAQTYSEFYGSIRKAESLDEIKRVYQEKATGVYVIGPDPPTINKDKVVENLRAKVLAQPSIYKKIVENVFEITRLELIYMPFYYFEVMYKDKMASMIVNGVSGKIIS